MRKNVRFIFSLVIVLLSFSRAHAGEIETNSRIEYNALNAPGANLVAQYDKFGSLPYSVSGPIQLISSRGLIEFGYDESKKIFHPDNLTSIVSFNYMTKDANLVSSATIPETLKITYNKEGQYTAQNFLKLTNTALIYVSSISIVTYKDYGMPSQAVVANPKDLYMEAKVIANEALLFDFMNPLPGPTFLGYNPITINSGVRELEAYWNYIPGAEEYEFEYIYIDNYDASSFSATKANSLINYDFDHDATRITTSDQFYRIPLVYEKGLILFRVRGVGRSLTNNYARLEGTWSNVGFEKGTVSNFNTYYSNQYYVIQTAHEQDNINWSSVRTFAENGKSGIGVNYEDGVMHSRQSLAKLNTDERIIAQASLYDWHGRPAISILPAPVNQSYFSYIQNLNLASVGGQFDKSVFDNIGLNPSGSCSPSGPSMDPVTSLGAANYYSTNNPYKESQQAMVPDANGYPYVQIDYYPDQTGRVKRQSLPGPTHKLGSGNENRFIYTTPSQTELVRLFGTEVGVASNYQKLMEIDPNGQTSVSYMDDEGRVIATGLAGASPANLIPLADATNSLTAQNATSVLTNNNNDPQNYILKMTDNFSGLLGETQTIDYTVKVPTYNNNCVPNLCLDCIYELEISLQDDCQNEFLDGDATTPGNQPITKILGRYDPLSIPSATTSCPPNGTLLNFSLSNPTPFSFVVTKTGSYHLVKTLKLSTAPIQQYAQEFIAQNTCILTLADFQNETFKDIDITGCESLDCSDCKASVLKAVSAFPANTISQAQIDALVEKCDLKCDLKNSCSAKEKLMLMHFKPNGYFGKYNGSYTSLDPLSVFNPTNTLHATLQIQPAGPAVFSFSVPPGTYSSGYTVLNPANNTYVTPNLLSAPNYIGSYIDTYSEPWLKWHPEFCKLKFECDAFINAIKAYSDMLDDTHSYDEACRKGLLTPMASMFSFANAPSSSACPTCSGSSNVYDPFVPSNYPAGSTYFSSTAITGASTTLKNSIYSMTYSNTATGQSVSGNIYQYAISAGSNLDINDVINGNIPFGNDYCTKDREWLIFKQLYLAFKDQLIRNLKTTFLSGWNSNNGGCLTNFSTLPGYVKVFPDAPSNTSISSLLSSYASGAGNPSSATSVPTGQLATQCSTYCQSYVNNWLQDLNYCFTTINPAPAIWTTIKADLLSVCNGGCDAQDPFGASNTNSGISITVNGNTYYVGSFNDVVQAYKNEGLIINTPNCTGYAISFPKPKGNSVTSTTSTAPPLDACGCNTILTAHDAYANALMSNSALSCTMSESEYASQNYGINLAYFNDYVCACKKSSRGNNMYDFSELTKIQLTTLVLPENLACKQCINCKTIGEIKGLFTKAFGRVTVNSIDHSVLTNWLNSTYNVNNTYDQWLTFINDCDKYAQGNSNVGNSTTQVNEFDDLFNILNQNGFLVPNTSSTPYILNTTNGNVFFNSSLWTNILPTSPPVVHVVVTPLTGAFSGFVVNLSSPTNPGFNCDFSFGSYYTTLPVFTGSFQTTFSGSYGKCDYNVTDPKEFNMVVTYPDANGVLQTYTLSATNTCYQTLYPFPNSVQNDPICSPYLCSNSLDEEPVNDCVQTLINNALNTAQTRYNTYITQQVNQFIADYKNYCYANVIESAKRTFLINEYQYTLYYYDRSGNLVHTVPPNGVDVITNTTDLANATTYVMSAGLSGSPFYPKHSLNPSAPTFPTAPVNSLVDGINRYVTNYEYNTYDAPTVEVTPDGGEARYFYDYVGRLALSQDAQKLSTNSYAYTVYDNFGRITEVGVIYMSTAVGDVLTDAILKDPAQLKTFIAAPYHVKKEVTRTYYDLPLNTPSNLLFTGGQQNIRERVTATTFEKVNDNNNNTYDYATFYSYDDHGNVDHLIHDNPALNYAGAVNRYKYIDYEYELISGNVVKISYQKNKPDQYYHTYGYDKDNRLHEVYTSKNDVVYTRDTKYFYYQHGPLARVEKGEYQVQGTDYAYTIQGWVKGINSNILTKATDMGKDGRKTTEFISTNYGVHQNFAKDAASYSLNYFTGDYNSIKSTSQNFLANTANLNSSAAGVGFKQSTDAPDLYNGNIASMVTSIYDINPLSPDFKIAKPQFTGYRYDQLHRIKQMKAYSSLRVNALPANINEAIDLTANSWKTPTAQNFVDIYGMSLDYDRNGNIEKLSRKGDASLSGSVWSYKKMDELSYHYTTNAAMYIPSLNKTISVNNRLRQVNDGTGPSYDAAYAGNYVGTDIDNQTDPDNYKYNAIGSLEQDASEEIGLIQWTAAKKVKSVERAVGSVKPDLYFDYNQFGQRISKTVVPRPGGVQDMANAVTSYYVLDATGSQLALYKDEPSQSSGPRTLTCSEHYLFGSDRLGVDNTTIDMLAPMNSGNKIYGIVGMKDFECTNHLGNILSTVSDRKLQVQGATIAIGNDFEAPFNYQSSSQPVSLSPFTCKLFAPSQLNGPVLNKQVYQGDVINAAVKYYYTNPVPVGDPSPGKLILNLTDALGNILYDNAGVLQTNVSNASVVNSWQTLMVTKTVPSVLYTDAAATMVYYGNVYTKSYTANLNQNFIWFDDHILQITPLSPMVVDYNPEIKTTTDYYAFGQTMPGRTYNNPEYRYSHNGQEKDNEIFQGALSAEYWEYDSRTGRRWEVDPITHDWESPYACFSNNPVALNDIDGAADDTKKGNKGKSRVKGNHTTKKHKQKGEKRKTKGNSDDNGKSNDKKGDKDSGKKPTQKKEEKKVEPKLSTKHKEIKPELTRTIKVIIHHGNRKDDYGWGGRLGGHALIGFENGDIRSFSGAYPGGDKSGRVIKGYAGLGSALSVNTIQLGLFEGVSTIFEIPVSEDTYKELQDFYYNWECDDPATCNRGPYDYGMGRKAKRCASSAYFQLVKAGAIKGRVLMYGLRSFNPGLLYRYLKRKGFNHQQYSYFRLTDEQRSNTNFYKFFKSIFYFIDLFTQKRGDKN